MNHIENYLETKDIQSLHKWVEENYLMFRDIVEKLIRKYGLYSFDKEDMFQEAIIIFYDKIDRYNPTMGTLSTFMYSVVSNELLHKLKIAQVHDFQRRVDVIEIDDVYTSDNGKLVGREETVSATDKDAVMNTILIGDLNEFVKTHLSETKQEIYRMYCQGSTYKTIATKMGFTKQYVSSVIQDLVESVRKEWRVNEY